MRRTQLQQRQAGIGLIEVMVAAVFVALSLVALAQVLGVTLTGSGESRVRLQALNSAQERIEQFRGLARRDQYPPLAPRTCDSLSAASTGLNTDLTRCWTVTACANSMACRQVRVEVTWQGVPGTEDRVTLTSYLAETDPVRGGIVLAR